MLVCPLVELEEGGRRRGGGEEGEGKGGGEERRERGVEQRVKGQVQ